MTTSPPPAEPILQHFDFAHLPPFLQETSRPFAELAHRCVADLPRDPERTVALRKLLEAKDAAVRARLVRHRAELEEAERERRSEEPTGRFSIPPVFTALDLNGETFEARVGDRLTYESVTKTVVARGGRVGLYSVAWSLGGNGPHGTLAPGEWTVVRPGMRISAMITDGA